MGARVIRFAAAFAVGFESPSYFPVLYQGIAMSKLLALFLALGLIVVPAMSLAAPDKEAPKTKEKEPKEKTKPKETVEWSQLATKKGELSKPEYKKGQAAKKPEPTKVEFSNEAAAFRVSWKTTVPEGKRGGALSMSLFKKETRGDKETYKRVDKIGSARGESEGNKVFTVGKGEYHVELEGDAIAYEITIESAEKKAD
jgi:hypothetical protein